MQYFINPHYSSISSSIKRITNLNYFNTHGKILHNGRNIIKRFDTDGISLVVKYYGHITQFNKLIYGTLRKSKAQRAYEYSQELHSLNINVHQEVAYVEHKSCGILHHSFFISLFSDYSSVSSGIKKYDSNLQDNSLIKATSEFIFFLHNNGVLHHDLNINNILYKKLDNNRYDFLLIDINRMQFCKKLTQLQRLNNLKRISLDSIHFIHLLQHYASLSNQDIEQTTLKGLFIRIHHEIIHSLKHSIKSFIYSHF